LMTGRGDGDIELPSILPLLVLKTDQRGWSTSKTQNIDFCLANEVVGGERVLVKHLDEDKPGVFRVTERGLLIELRIEVLNDLLALKQLKITKSGQPHTQSSNDGKPISRSSPTPSKSSHSARRSCPDSADSFPQ